MKGGSGVGTILDRIAREGFPEEVMFELRAEGSEGTFQAKEHSSWAKTLKNSTCGVSWGE